MSFVITETSSVASKESVYISVYEIIYERVLFDEVL